MATSRPKPIKNARVNSSPSSHGQIEWTHLMFLVQIF
jgi:hypothetical protein